jgi:hypothetical protein
METRHCDNCKKLNTQTPLYALDRYFQKKWDPVRGVNIETAALLGCQIYALREKLDPEDVKPFPRAGGQEFCKECLAENLKLVLEAI